MSSSRASSRQSGSSNRAEAGGDRRQSRRHPGMTRSSGTTGDSPIFSRALSNSALGPSYSSPPFPVPTMQNHARSPDPVGSLWVENAGLLEYILRVFTRLFGHRDTGTPQRSYVDNSHQYDYIGDQIKSLMQHINQLESELADKHSRLDRERNRANRYKQRVETLKLQASARLSGLIANLENRDISTSEQALDLLHEIMVYKNEANRLDSLARNIINRFRSR
ncbi:hypothetical protein SCAR479_08213 [Seiridium cardinale]|uniref:Uncharacterized protein n=1 Tax=Seiridium cardinale TaxID=138064 RepID=A0ABR2XNI9_9PEZI